MYYVYDSHMRDNLNFLIYIFQNKENNLKSNYALILPVSRLYTHVSIQSRVQLYLSFKQQQELSIILKENYFILIKKSHEIA